MDHRGGGKGEDLLAGVREFARANGLLTAGDRVLAAVSGGVDSMVLLALLDALRADIPFDLAVAHFDHGLRGAEGRRAADFVGREARRRHLRFHRGQGDARAWASRRGRGIEDAARELRYRFLRSAMVRWGGTRLATAHHADDQAETVLLRLLRGTGPAGLAGIPAIGPGGLVRPLLSLSREEIRACAEAWGVPHVEDPTNRDLRYLRNRIRTRLLPLLEREYAPEARRLLARAATLGREERDYLEGVVQSALTGSLAREGKGSLYLDLERLAGYHYFVMKHVLRAAVMQVTEGEVILSREATDLAVQFLRGAQSGSVLDLPRGVRLERSFGEVAVRRGRPSPGEGSREIPLHPGKARTVVLGGRALHVEIRRHEGQGWPARSMPEPEEGALRELFDAEALDPPLRCRGWREGDRMRPWGLAGTRKLREILAEGRVPREKRGSVPVIADARDILWAVGLRRAAKGGVTPSTREVWEVRVTPLEGEA